MNKLLVICGPTATGKTKLALHLAKKFKGEVISADARQIYRYMDIGTGKESKVHGYDLVNPNENFSVSHYMKFANKTIKDILASNKLPILVGGTGLYIKGVVDGIETAEIMPDKVLRENLKDRPSNELFKLLKNIDSIKAESMNDSDRKNPRRLIRAIEISSQKGKAIKKSPVNNFSTLFIGLKAPLEVLKTRIEERVDERVKKGFKKEIDFLKNHNYWKGAPQFTLGYKDWPYVDKWKREEIKYAKRQMTWFKKDSRINWFDLTDIYIEKKVEKLVQKWYKL